MELAVSSIEKAAPPRPRTPIGRSEFLLFNQQLAAIARAGIPLERSLRKVAADVGSPRLRRLIKEVTADLEAGTSPEEAFARRKKHFPPLYGRIVEAGVCTGRLPEMLTSLNRHLELAGRTRRLILEALCYPVVVLLIAAGVLGFFFFEVIPAYEPIYKDLGKPLPAITRLFMSLSHNAVGIAIGVAAVIAGVVLLKFALGATARGRRLKEWLLLRVPVIGGIHRAATLGRLADTMSTLVGAGCDLPACVRLGAEASGSEHARQDAEALAAYVEGGGALSEFDASACRIVPDYFLYSAYLGAERNELQDNLAGLAEMYAQQAQIRQGMLQALLPPSLLVAVGLTVGAGIFALFAPLAAMLRHLQM
jgi:type II secretory pathway component PulF